MKIHRKALVFTVSLVAVLALSACGKKEEATPAAPAATPAAEQAPAPAAAAPVAVASVDIGTAVDAGEKMSAATTTFAPSDTIYASISTTGTGDAAFGVKWTYQDGQTVKEDSKTIHATGPATTEFHISKPSGWPVGGYKVEISLNGQSAGSKDFSVK